MFAFKKIYTLEISQENFKDFLWLSKPYFKRICPNVDNELPLDLSSLVHNIFSLCIVISASSPLFLLTVYLTTNYLRMMV